MLPLTPVARPTLPTVFATGLRQLSTYSALDLKRGYVFLEVVYALLAVSIVFASIGAAVVRREKRGSGCPLSAPKPRGEDDEGSGVWPLGGEDMKSMRAC